MKSLWVLYYKTKAALCGFSGVIFYVEENISSEIIPLIFSPIVLLVILFQ